MNLDANIKTVLGPLVGKRVSPDTFTQPSGNMPTWPAIMYSVTSQVPFATICGDGDEDDDDPTADTHLQLELAAESSRARTALKKSVRTAMKSFVPIARWENTNVQFYDEDTRTYRAVMEYSLHASTLATS